MKKLKTAEQEQKGIVIFANISHFSASGTCSRVSSVVFLFFYFHLDSQRLHQSHILIAARPSDLFGTPSTHRTHRARQLMQLAMQVRTV
jgi:hypothetical protein